MKTIISIYLLCFIYLSVFAQNNVGIGTNTPLARLHVLDSNVLFSATGLAPITPGNTPISGAGRRLMWYADRGAFRVGYVSSNKWDQNNIGFYSIAAGYDTKSSGTYSIAMGNGSTALGESAVAMGGNNTASVDFSTALGAGTTASGLYSTAMGNSSLASGTNAIAMGQLTHATNNSATAMGNNTTASGTVATAMGFNSLAGGAYATAMGNNGSASGESATALGNFTTASGFYSTALGSNTIASGDFSVAMGEFVNARSAYETVLGKYNTVYTPSSTTFWIPSDRLFSVSNGTSSGARSDAFTILKNGYLGMGTSLPTAKLHIKHNSYPDPSLLIEETENDYTRMEFRNTSVNSFWQMNAKAQTVAANAQLEFWNSSAGVPTTPLIIYGNGDATLSGTLTQNSDSRLKRNVEPLELNLEKLIQVKGYNYYWKSEAADQEIQTGVLAQELQKIFPSLVKKDKEGILSVNYIGLIPVLIESVKEQQKQIDELKLLVTRLLKNQ